MLIHHLSIFTLHTNTYILARICTYIHTFVIHRYTTHVASDPLDPLVLFQEDVNDDDYEIQIQAMNRIHIIAHAMGPSRVRSELIPFLTDYLDVDNDEAHTAIARQLGTFVRFVGGQQHLPLLLPLLEKLCGTEEVVVRDESVVALSKIAGQMSKQDVESKMVPVIQRLSNGDWFTTRVSACGLFVAVYDNASDAGVCAELRSLFNNLTNDDTPMVRKAAYQKLGEFGSILDKAYFKSDILPTLRQIAEDDVDVMRIYTIRCCQDLALKIDSQEFLASLCPILDAMQDDQSWRVRQALVRGMPTLVKNCSNQIASKRLLPLYGKLLKDKEAEVRSAACNVLDEVCEAIDGHSSIVDNIAPILDTLAVDQVQSVRVAFSKKLVQCCPYFGKEVSAKVLIPIIQQLAKDEIPDVRNNIVDGMRVILETDCLNPQTLTVCILPILLELAKDVKWRVRIAVVKQLGPLARSLGVKAFEKKLQNIIILSLSDHVYAIREAACTQIGNIVAEFGGKWAADKLFPGAFAIYDKTTNYLHRMTCLQVINNCTKATNCSADTIEKHLLPLVVTSCHDDVPNVRILAAQCLGLIAPRIDKMVVTAKLKPLLLKLAKDPDSDVSYFAGQSLKECK